MASLVMAGLHPVGLFFFARGAGVYSAIPTSGSPPEGPFAILLFAFFGAFCGLMAAFVLFPIINYTAFLFGRNTGGSSWAVLGGALLGALSFAIWAATGRE